MAIEEWCTYSLSLVTGEMSSTSAWFISDNIIYPKEGSKTLIILFLNPETDAS